MNQAAEDLLWARQLLAKDEFYAQMSPQEQERIIQEAVDFGSHLAEKTRERLGAPAGVESISRMLSGLGAGVRIDETNGLPGPMAEYAEDLLMARFYTQRIRQRAVEAAERGEWSSGWYELYEQCLARELFRHVENTISGKASHHIRFKDKVLGVLPVSRPVETTRQIAGLVFVRDFLQLTSLPLLMLDP